MVESRCCQIDECGEEPFPVRGGTGVEQLLEQEAVEQRQQQRGHDGGVASANVGLEGVGDAAAGLSVVGGHLLTQLGRTLRLGDPFEECDEQRPRCVEDTHGSIEQGGQVAEGRVTPRDEREERGLRDVQPKDVNR